MTTTALRIESPVSDLGPINLANGQALCLEEARRLTELQLDLAKQLCLRVELPVTDPTLIGVLQALAINYAAETHRRKIVASSC